MLVLKLYELGTTFDKKRFSLSIPRGAKILGVRLISYNARPRVGVLEDKSETKTDTKNFILATAGIPFEGEMEKLVSCGSYGEFELFEIKK